MTRSGSAWLPDERDTMLRHLLESLVSAVNDSPDARAQEIRHITAGMAFLLNQKPQGPEITDPLRLVDEMLLLAEPVVRDRNIRWHITPAADLPGSVTLTDPDARHRVLTFLLDASRHCEKGILPLDLSVTHHELEIAIGDNLLRLQTSEAEPLPLPAQSPYTRHALILGVKDRNRTGIVRRLERLGISTTQEFHQGVDLCIVADDHSEESQAILRTMPSNMPVLLLDNRVVYHNESWIPVRDPLTQGHLKEAIASAGFNRRTGQQHVLVVDDSSLSRQLIEDLLIAMGHEVDCACSGSEAMERARARHYNLVIMDIQMPDMDGRDATRRILALKPGTTVLGLTAHATIDEKRACREAGMLDVLIKPVRRKSLEKLLSRPARAPKSVSGRLSLPVFDTTLALDNAGGKPEVAQELFHLLIESLESDRRILADMALHDHESLRRHVHRLNGAVRYSGVPRLSRAVDSMESALKEQPQMIEAMRNLLIAEISALLEWAAEHPQVFSRQGRPGHSL